MGANESSLTAACCCQAEGRGPGEDVNAAGGVPHAARGVPGLPRGKVSHIAGVNSPTLSSDMPWSLRTPPSSPGSADRDAIEKTKRMFIDNTQQSFLSKDHVRVMKLSRSKAKGQEAQLKDLTEKRKALQLEEEIYRHRQSKDPGFKDLIAESKLEAQMRSNRIAMTKAQQLMREHSGAADHAEGNTAQGGGGNLAVPALFRANRSVDPNRQPSPTGARSKSPTSRPRAKK